MEKYCYKCGAKLRDGAKFCQSCGARLEGGPGDVSSNISDAVANVATSASKVSGAVLDGVKNQGARIGLEGVSSVSTMPLVIVDAALLVVVTFLPWVSSYYAEAGSGLSLPALAKEGINYISALSQHSTYAYRYGADQLYQSAIGVLVLVSLVAGIGWLSSLASLYYDVKHDLRGERSSGGGSKTVAGLAVIVQALVWIGVAYLKSSLANDYFDVSYALSGVVETTIWVWLSLVAGIVGYFLRQSIYQSLGWAKATNTPAQGGKSE